jgi:predicted MFS family arabinose efflux permease
VAGVALQGAAALLYAVIPDVRWMLLPQIMLGVGLSIFWPAFLSYFAEVAAGALIQMQMRRSIVQGSALLVTPLIVTYLAGRLSYSAGFAVVGVMTLAAAVVGLQLRGPAGRRTATSAGPRPLWATYRSAGALFKRRSYLLILGLSIVASLLIYLVNATFLTLHLKTLGFTGLAIGALISLRSLSDVTLRTAFSWLAGRIRPIVLVALSALGVALVSLALPAFAAPAAVVALMLLLGVLASQYDPSSVTVLSNLLKAEERDVGVAVWVTINSFAAWIAAPLLGGLADSRGLSAVFVVSALVGIVAVTGLMWLGRRAAARPDAPDELVEMFG